MHSVHIKLTHLIFSDCFRADVSCSKLPLRWLDVRVKCDGVGGLEICTQSFLDDDLNTCGYNCSGREGGREKEIIRTPLDTLHLKFHNKPDVLHEL